MPERHPLSPAGPVLAPSVRGSRVSEEQPWHLPGEGTGRGPSPLPKPFTPLGLHLHLLAHLQNLAEAPGDPQWMETIGRDLHRQFPLHEMFVSPQGHGYEAGDAQGPPAPDPQALWPSP